MKYGMEGKEGRQPSPGRTAAVSHESEGASRLEWRQLVQSLKHSREGASALEPVTAAGSSVENGIIRQCCCVYLRLRATQRRANRRVGASPCATTQDEVRLPSPAPLAGDLRAIISSQYPSTAGS
ncbi:hypothetical protein E2C01_052900 [Portunus trituberculatus]|uniref:Uncharacterized protein n=1 Tax=Portunus trituberculatus TaxID=210409 RepID=A0A5B7GPF2_PORTR|nr:hypothetical protein [Portunus trituberculatus]